MEKNVLSTINIIIDDRIDNELIDKISYLIKYTNQEVEDVIFNNGNLLIKYNGTDETSLKKQVHSIVSRISKKRSNSIREKVVFIKNLDVPGIHDILPILIKNKIIKRIGEGTFTYHEPFSLLYEFLDYLVVNCVAKPLKAKKAMYPSIIPIEALDRTNYFSSFPQHINYLTHLSENIDTIEEFTNELEKSHKLTNDKLSKARLTIPQYVNNPAVCYHSYNSLSNQVLDNNTILTSIGNCNRYEGNNHNEFGRLLDFTMREIIFIGTDEFIKSKREESLSLLEDLVDFWGFDCQLENANDPFFTDDNRVKATFQRAYEMKYELKVNIPYNQQKLAVCSSNYHGDVMGKAYDIKIKNGYASTGCLAFGMERWVFAFLSQYGIEEEFWPPKFLDSFNKWKEEGFLEIPIL